MSVLKLKLTQPIYDLLRDEVGEDKTVHHPLADELIAAFNNAGREGPYRTVRVDEEGGRHLLDYLNTYRDEREVTDNAIARGEIPRTIYQSLNVAIPHLESALAATR